MNKAMSAEKDQNLRYSTYKAYGEGKFYIFKKT